MNATSQRAPPRSLPLQFRCDYSQETQPGNRESYGLDKSGPTAFLNRSQTRLGNLSSLTVVHLRFGLHLARHARAALPVGGCTGLKCSPHLSTLTSTGTSFSKL